VGFIATRKKQGFAVPVAAWLRGELRGWATERLPQAARLGLSATAVQQLWDEHLTGRRNRWRELWAVLVLCEWSARWRATL
jgi:asparagine synthase (glutamine-hydrolysing)